MASLTPGRQSPFRRQPSTNTAPIRASTPNTSPVKSSLLSPARGGSVTLDDESPLARTIINNREASREPASPTVGGLRGERSPSPVKTNAFTPTKLTQNESPIARQGESPIASPVRRTAGIPAYNSPSTQINTQDTTPKLKQPTFTNKPVATAPILAVTNGMYKSVPAPLLRSFRESFEVLDPNATGSLTSTALSPVLEQLGLSHDAAALSHFFLSGKAQSMNLAAYLDMLSSPYSQLSAPNELAAAFGAFDIDDSGQIDVEELRDAVFKVMPEPGEANPGARLNEREMDEILQDFVGRRAFGSKGLSAAKSGTAGRGDVFRWREFVSGLNGGVDEDKAQPVAV